MKNNFAPRSKFEKWVREIGGTKRLSEYLEVNQSTVQHWLAGRAKPGLEVSFKIVRLSRKKLTLKDIVDGTNGL